jgi:hypothetical protein
VLLGTRQSRRDPDDLGSGQRSVRQVHEPDREELPVVQRKLHFDPRRPQLAAADLIQVEPVSGVAQARRSVLPERCGRWRVGCTTGVDYLDPREGPKTAAIQGLQPVSPLASAPPSETAARYAGPDDCPIPGHAPPAFPQSLDEGLGGSRPSSNVPTATPVLAWSSNFGVAGMKDSRLGRLSEADRDTWRRDSELSRLAWVEKRTRLFHRRRTAR